MKQSLTLHEIYKHLNRLDKMNKRITSIENIFNKRLKKLWNANGYK